jgi:hypothetical protein
MMRPVHLPANTSPLTFIQTSVSVGQESLHLARKCKKLHCSNPGEQTAFTREKRKRIQHAVRSM